MTKGRLAIFGAGGHGKVVAEIAIAVGWQEVVFYDDEFPSKKFLGDHVVSGNLDHFVSDAASYDGLHIAIGSNNIRFNLIEKLEDREINLPNIIHSSAVISKTASLAGAVCVMPGVIVNAGSEIGTGVILNTASLVDHDCKISNAAHISPGAHLGGGVNVGSRSWVGIGASVIQGIKIGSDAIIGAGSVVIRDVPSDVTSVGVPSRVIR